VTAIKPALCARRRGEIVEMVVQPGNHPAGLGPEAYLFRTSQATSPEDARKDGHIRGRRVSA
jgi:hypothetical protein